MSVDAFELPLAAEIPPTPVSAKCDDGVTIRRLVVSTVSVLGVAMDRDARDLVISEDGEERFRVRLGSADARHLASLLTARDFTEDSVQTEIARIEADCGRAGVPIEAFCGHAQIARSVWTRWKSGQNSPTFSTWARVRQAHASMSRGPAHGISASNPRTGEEAA